MKYNFIEIDNHKCICLSTYAGKTVKGVAKCSPKDNWDLQTGCNLARMRCDAKIAKMRKANALKQLEKAREALIAANHRFEQMASYVTDASIQYDEISDRLKAYEAEL